MYSLGRLVLNLIHSEILGYGSSNFWILELKVFLLPWFDSIKFFGMWLLGKPNSVVWKIV